jgi:hypothetical protein
MARDIIHHAVKNALIKEGWTITHDPFRVDYEELTLFADLAAERALANEQYERKIVLEIKSFVGRSFVEDLQRALGQYLIYRDLLRETSPEYRVYLAFRQEVYEEFFGQKAVQLIVRAHQLNLLIVNVTVEEVVKWIN